MTVELVLLLGRRLQRSLNISIEALRHVMWLLRWFEDSVNTDSNSEVSKLLQSHHSLTD